MSTSDLKKIFGDNLRRFRGEKPQPEVAKLLGVAQQNYSRMESGKNLPRLEKAKEIADLFHTTIDSLLERNGVGEQLTDRLSNSAVEFSGSVRAKALELLQVLKCDNFQELIEHLIRVEYERRVPSKVRAEQIDQNRE